MTRHREAEVAEAPHGAGLSGRSARIGRGALVAFALALAASACAGAARHRAGPPGPAVPVVTSPPAPRPAASLPRAARRALQCTGRYVPPGTYGTYQYARAEVPESTPDGLQVARRRALADLLHTFCPDGRGCDTLRRFTTAWAWGHNHGQWCYVYLVRSRKLDEWIAGQTDKHLLDSLRREVRELLAGVPPGSTVAVQPVFDATRQRMAGARGRFLAVRIARELRLGGWRSRRVDPAAGSDARPGDAATLRTRIIDVRRQRRPGVELHITARLLRAGVPVDDREGRPIHVRASVLPDAPAGPVRLRGTLLLLRCRSTPAGACPRHDADPLVARLRAMASGLGVSAVAISRPNAPRGSADARDRGLRAGVAHVLEVSLAARYQAREDGVLYAFSSCSANLVQTSSGRSLGSMSCEPEAKGAVYAKVGALRHSPIDAARDALNNAVQEVIDRAPWWDRSAGSRGNAGF